MGYTNEFIKELPEHMRQDIAALNREIQALEVKRAKLELPINLAISIDEVAKKKAEATAIIDGAHEKAAKILLDAESDADTLIDDANARAADGQAVSETLMGAAETVKAAAEKEHDEAVAWKAELDDRKRKLDVREAALQKREESLVAEIREIRAAIERLK